jgi:hypothetical protein
MARDTHAAIDDLRKLARADSRDVTWAEFFALPPAEQVVRARFDLQKVRRKFERLLKLAREENNERHIRICEENLQMLAESEASLDKTARSLGSV